MKNEYLYGIVGLAAGLILAAGSASFAVRNDNHGMMRVMGLNTPHEGAAEDRGTGSAPGNGHMSMDDMTAALRGKTGDAFDKAFLELMIEHHEGAVDMAGLIPANAKHDEVKTLGAAIIKAQTEEIASMKQWQKDWGYTSFNSGNGHMMGH